MVSPLSAAVAALHSCGMSSSFLLLVSFLSSLAQSTCPAAFCHCCLSAVLFLCSPAASPCLAVVAHTSCTCTCIHASLLHSAEHICVLSVPTCCCRPLLHFIFCAQVSFSLLHSTDCLSFACVSASCSTPFTQFLAFVLLHVTSSVACYPYPPLQPCASFTCSFMLSYITCWPQTACLLHVCMSAVHAQHDKQVALFVQV